MKKLLVHYSEQGALLSNQFANDMADFTQKGKTNLPEKGKPAGEALYLFTNICVNLRNLINKIHTNPRGVMNLIHAHPPLQSAVNFGIIFTQSQKTTASRGKLNLLQAHSTPQACFFMRNIRTPQENADFVLFIQNLNFLSMVERSGQPFAVGCLPVMAVFHPVTFYRPTVESQAVVPRNQLQELLAMIYKFLCVNRPLPHFNLCVITLNTTTEEQARLCLSSDFRHVATIARINPKSHRTLPVNHALSVSAMGVNHA